MKTHIPKNLGTNHFDCLSRQLGVTLIELMISMLIGIFLIGGLYTVFEKTKSSYRYQNGLVQIQEQGRFAITFLTQSLRIAGYPSDDAPTGNKIEGADGTTDTVAIRLRNDVNCQDAATAGIAQNNFRINNGNLECSGDNITWDIYVENIEDMQIMYGEDSDADGVANRYVTATDGPTWNNVVTARVSLLVRSSDFAAGRPEDYFDLNGNTVAAADERLRRTFVTTILLRN